MRHKTSQSTNWTTLLQRALNDSRVLPPGDGWSKFEEIRKTLGLGPVKARRILNAAITQREVEVFEGLDLNLTGKLCRAVWYRRVVK